MNEQYINALSRQVDHLKLHVESQKQLIDRSLECLAQVKASLSVSKAIKSASGEVLSLHEQEMYKSLIVEAYDAVSKQMECLQKMELEMRTMEAELSAVGSE
ncbi:hypothetical protein ACSVIJ_03660 [Pseudomonas sp. NCHU5208]|uniref:hypothetical protein n=1 Tax=unclassified Pseudomonas TaxID=196821 RepID=UPI003F9A50BA